MQPLSDYGCNTLLAAYPKQEKARAQAFIYLRTGVHWQHTERFQRQNAPEGETATLSGRTRGRMRTTESRTERSRTPAPAMPTMEGSSSDGLPPWRQPLARDTAVQEFGPSYGPMTGGRASGALPVSPYHPYAVCPRRWVQNRQTSAVKIPFDEGCSQATCHSEAYEKDMKYKSDVDNMEVEGLLGFLGSRKVIAFEIAIDNSEVPTGIPERKIKLLRADGSPQYYLHIDDWQYLERTGEIANYPGLEPEMSITKVSDRLIDRLLKMNGLGQISEKEWDFINAYGYLIPYATCPLKKSEAQRRRRDHRNEFVQYGVQVSLSDILQNTANRPAARPSQAPPREPGEAASAGSGGTAPAPSRTGEAPGPQCYYCYADLAYAWDHDPKGVEKSKCYRCDHQFCPKHITPWDHWCRWGHSCKNL